jgi:lysozyme family protein
MTVTFVEGKDWAASGAAIRGLGEASSVFRGLQADLNLFGGAVGFELVKVDGLVGAATTSAFRAVYDAVIAKNAMLAATPFAVPDSAANVATYAAMLREWLTTTALAALAVSPLRKYVFGHGKDWNVKDEIAYGAGPIHEEFIALQTQLNRFASTCGFSKLDTDGLIGAKTAAAVSKVYERVVAKNPMLAATPFPPPDTKEEVAEYSQFIGHWLTDTAGKALLAEAVG